MTDLDISLRVFHFKTPARTSRGTYTQRNSIILTATDRYLPGRIGLGECAPLPDLSCDRDAYTMLPSVMAIINAAFDSGDVAEYLREYPALSFAYDSANHDLYQTPALYQTPFARSEVGIPTNGLVWMSKPDEMLQQVKRKIMQGFHCIKLKIGANNWDEELALISKIRSRFTPDTIELRLDANGAFKPDEAHRVLDQLAPLGIHSIEQPIAPYQWKAMAKLCNESPVPIALDEELIGVNKPMERETLLDTIRPQFIVIKPTLHGGFLGAMEWMSFAEKRGIGSWLTSALESNIGLRNIALLAAATYGRTGQMMPQGLGTGLLFTDNIEMDIELRGSKLWRCPVAEVE